MSADKKLNPNGHQLSVKLAESRQSGERKPSGQVINVAGVGRFVSTAYEQLRNAAEYAQEHLLIQNAIRRFFVRNLSFQNHNQPSQTIAEELVIELTQSGYIQNNTILVSVVNKLGKSIQKYYENYWRMKLSGADDRIAESWTLDLLSLKSEDVLLPGAIQTDYLQFAYHHYCGILDKKAFALNKAEVDEFEVSVYVAVHRALFKSDIAAVRYDMQKLYKASDSNINEYIDFHQNIDKVFASELTNKIVRYINKYGAPLRILKSMIADSDNVAELMADSAQFDRAYTNQIKKEYRKSEKKLNGGLLKSIVFLLITKTLVGFAIEVPYDLITTGVVLMVPLIVNMLTPIVYLALLRLGFQLPGDANARAIRLYADDMLYGDINQVNLYPSIKEKKYPVSFTIAYALLFLTVFAGVSYILMILDFNIVQGVMFFMFLAAASFLGFRLSRIVRELELVTVKPGILMTIRDLIFTPFTFLGKWISDKYQKVNVVALVLDTFIELPLKTVLRLLRQWTGFIDDKKDSF
ncbi:hypothetical protein HGB25_02290 [Candidatus Saccharibacteria bacterium]|nr:hypothetical protein [Candidatus Saccharibacteria bacterium]